MRSSLEEIVDHIRDCFKSKEVESQLQEFLVGALYPELQDYEPLYIALPFWSQNEPGTEPTDTGNWAHIPCLIVEPEIALAYALFFSRLSQTEFSFSTWVAREKKSYIPRVIEFHREEADTWPSDDGLVTVATNGKFAPESCCVLRIAAPWLTSLEVRESQTEEHLRLRQLLLRQDNASGLYIMDWWRLKERAQQIEKLLEEKGRQLVSVYAGDEFGDYKTSLHNAIASGHVMRRLGVSSWNENRTAALATFIVSYSLIPRWQHAYHLPSKIIKWPEDDDLYERGSGGPIIVTVKDAEPVLNWVSVATNLEYRVMSLGDWVEKGRTDLRKQAILTAVAAIMARNASHNTGSHGLAHLIGGTLPWPDEDDMKVFLRYIKARMDFVAELTTYWRELPWLEQ